MKRFLIALTLLIALSTAVVLPSSARPVSAAPQTSAHVSSRLAAFDKTKFLLHLGAAYYAFHHFVYSPYTSHKLGRTHLIGDVKAAAGLLFAYHETKTAYDLAKTSNSKTLHIFIAPLTLLENAFSSARSKITHGDTSGISSLNGQANSFQGLAGKSGYGFKDTTATVPGT